MKFDLLPFLPFFLCSQYLYCCSFPPSLFCVYHTEETNKKNFYERTLSTHQTVEEDEGRKERRKRIDGSIEEDHLYSLFVPFFAIIKKKETNYYYKNMKRQCATVPYPTIQTGRLALFTNQSDSEVCILYTLLVSLQDRQQFKER